MEKKLKLIQTFNKIQSLKKEKNILEKQIDKIGSDIDSNEDFIFSIIKPINNIMFKVETEQLKLTPVLDTKAKPINEIYYGYYKLLSIKENDSLIKISYSKHINCMNEDYEDFHIVKIPISYFNMNIDEIKLSHIDWVINKIKISNEEILRKKEEYLALKIKLKEEADKVKYLELKKKYEN